MSTVRFPRSYPSARSSSASQAASMKTSARFAATAAYITAANPRGEARTAWENEIANAALVESQTQAGYSCYEGEGRDPQGRWTPERSVLVVGIARTDAEALGRVFEQNAIVFVEKGRSPELVLISG